MKYRSLGLWLHLVAGALLLARPNLGPAADHQHLPSKVLAAFREVAAEPAKSTVQIYCDNYRSALGAVVDKSGYIVTKASELKGKIEAQLPGGKKLEARMVGSDAALDLAVLKIDAADLPVIAWSETDAPPVGSWLVTPGIENNPVAIGVLSVSPRKIPAPQGALGISLGRIDESTKDDPAKVEDVMPDSAAEKAGLEADDVILQVNDTPIKGSQHLVDTIKGYQPGDKVELKVKRGDEEKTLKATLGSRSQLEGGERAEFQNALGGQLSERRAGFGWVIQHDSILKPAECGGPLVDLDGKAVGLNIARAGRVESYALTASVVRDAVKKLLATHQTSTPAVEAPKER
jgi:serine protease Do